MEKQRIMAIPVKKLRRSDPVPISDTTVVDLSSGKTTNEIELEAVTAAIASTKIEKSDVENKKPVSTIPAETSKVTKTVVKSPKRKSRMPLEEIVRELQNTSCNVVKPLLEEKISKNSNVTPDCLTELDRSNNQTEQLPDDLQDVKVDTSLFESVDCCDLTNLRETYGVNSRRFRADELF